jgi:hypothetical protein
MVDRGPEATPPLGIQGQLGLEVGTGGLDLVQVGLVRRELSHTNQIGLQAGDKEIRRFE